jgi:type IV pilus assembly protein PilQ
MRDWTKAMAALLAAVSSVCVVQALSAQVAQEPSGTTKPAMKADEADPFAKSPSTPAAAPAAQGRDLGQGELNVSGNMVDLKVDNVNITSVLGVLAEKTHKNIVASKSVTGTISANLYNVTLQEALDAILHANGYAYRQKGNFIYIYTVDELKKIEKDERKAVTEVFKLNYTPAIVAQDMVKPALSADAIIAVSKASLTGLPTDATTAGGDAMNTADALVITDYAENIDQVRKILKGIDQRPQQVLVEATIMVTKLNDNNSLGVDFSLLGGVDFATAGTTNTAGLSTNGAIPAGLSDSNFNAVGTNNQVSSTQTPPKGGLNVGVVTNNVAVFVNALEQITDSTVLANPKVLTLNKQAGAVIVGRKDGYYTSTTTSTTTVQSVEYLETGTRLIFRPFIGDDGFIRMEIHPEDSNGSVGANGLPSKQTTEVTTNILVRDGHTIVIGGLFREENKITKSQVPLLGDIPLAGYLFKQQNDTADRQEVIVLITPHIIKDHAMYSDASEEVMKHIDLMRVGIRKGMMPWSRDRLAEMAYGTAREEASKKYYDRDRAMWYLDCATNLNPGFSEALVMKQKISGEQMLESDNSSMRHFLADLVMEERTGQVPAKEPLTPATQPVPETIGPVTAPPSQQKVTPVEPKSAVEPAPAVQPAPAAAPAPAPAPVAPAAPAVETPAAPAAPAAPAVEPESK